MRHPVNAETLISACRLAGQHAYAPYSGWHVGSVAVFSAANGNGSFFSF